MIELDFLPNPPWQNTYGMTLTAAHVLTIHHQVLSFPYHAIMSIISNIACSINVTRILIGCNTLPIISLGSSPVLQIHVR